MPISRDGRSLKDHEVDKEIDAFEERERNRLINRLKVAYNIWRLTGMWSLALCVFFKHKLGLCHVCRALKSSGLPNAMREAGWM
jgi:hypothetical protein